jgi:hypothetical protein
MKGEAAMTKIIAGRFEQQSQVQQAVAEILRAGFSEDQVSTFFLTPAGQHGTYPLGGDHDKSPGAEHTAAGRAAGMATGGAVGAAVGAITTPLTGPLGALTGAFVGAHIGSMAGSLSNMEDDGEDAARHQVPVRHAGMMVAVSVPDASAEDRVIDALRVMGAADIECTEGTIVNGDWEDFDPAAPPHFLDDQSNLRPQH